MPKDITYEPFHEGYGGRVVILKDVISRPFNYVDKNDQIKMLIRNVWGGRFSL
jgi:hypothetical protein